MLGGLPIAQITLSGRSTPTTPSLPNSSLFPSQSNLFQMSCLSKTLARGPRPATFNDAQMTMGNSYIFALRNHGK